MSRKRDSSDRPALENADHVQGLSRGLAIIGAFGPGRRTMTLTEAASATGLSRAAARRSLLTLEHLGFVNAEGRKFHLTARVLDLASAYLSTLDFSAIAEPVLERLVERLGESCTLGVIEGDDVVFVMRVSRIRIMNSGSIRIGTRLPAALTAMGRVLIGYLPEAELVARCALPAPQRATPYTVVDRAQLEAMMRASRADGYAIVDRELDEGMRQIAVPLLAGDGRPLAALSVSVGVQHGTVEHLLRDVLPALNDARTEIERAVLRWH